MVTPMVPAGIIIDSRTAADARGIVTARLPRRGKCTLLAIREPD